MIYEKTVTLTVPFDEALEQVKAAFASEGFGTLTEIDMQATLKAKIDKDMDRYVIVGACNPKLAGAALDIVPQIGALLPCNVVVREVADGVAVEAMDPGLMGSVTANPDMEPIAEEAQRLIHNAMERLS
ncbi:MAG: DUF302 domain-containing protein [Acidimicrobiales bacterium]